MLEVIAERFAFDRMYTEPEVNAIIGQFHDDHCTLRRDMIGEGLMGRENGTYWRIRQK